MVNYRYVGYGVTNNNGVATLDYDANGDPLQSSGLVGTGAGKLDVVASLDNPIEQGSFVSETYDVLDCINYDKGMSGDGNHNDIWHLSSSSVTLTRGDTGSIVDIGVAWGTVTLGSLSTFIPVECVIEFDLLEFDPEMVIELRSSVQQSGSWVYSALDKVVGHHRWEISSNVQKQYVDGTLRKTLNQNLGEAFLFHFICGSVNKSCKFSNFKVYPI